MDDIESLLETVRTLYDRLEKLRAMEGPQIVLLGNCSIYKETLEDAYTAYGKIETVVEELGQELEYQHKRLDEEARKYGGAGEEVASE